MSEAGDQYYKLKDGSVEKTIAADKYITELEEQNNMMLDLLKNISKNTDFFGTEEVFEDIIQSITGGKE